MTTMQLPTTSKQKTASKLKPLKKKTKGATKEEKKRDQAIRRLR